MAEKNEKLMPRGLIPSSPEVLAAAKKYTPGIMCSGICRHSG